MSVVNNVSSGKKSISRRNRTKEAVGDKSVDNGITVNNQLQKLGNLKGLSIMRSAGNEPANTVIAKASKTALDDLSNQLEKRKSKESMISDIKAARKVVKNPIIQNKIKPTNDKSIQNVPTMKNRVTQNPPTANQSLPAPKINSDDEAMKTLLKSLKQPTTANKSLHAPKNKSDDEAMKALLKSSLPKNTAKPVMDINSPAMQRKLLFEKLAADEKIKETRKPRNTSKKSFVNNLDIESRNPTEPTDHSNTKKLVKDSMALLTRPVKKEPDLSNREVNEKDDILFQNEIAESDPRKNRNSHRAPLVTKIKKENVDIPEDVTNLSKEPMAKESHPMQVQPLPPASETSLTPEQVEILSTQFEIKDYLSRKEMRLIALKANLTDAQVRDWFKARRIQEDTPMIVDEKHTNVQLSSNPVNIKQEPVDIDDPHINNSIENNAIANIRVKQEPDDEPDSAVLDPLTGKLLKKSKVDKKIEEILAKAPLLDSLTRKIEMVNNLHNDGKDKVKNQINDIIDILDDEIEITKENIVNPGPKEKPLSKVLNKFLTQVEQLEKSMNVNEVTKNIEIETIIKEASRKDEIIKDLNIEVNENRTEVRYLGKELQDKNDEIEGILLNSVSKETFIRTQFQSLASEVRKLKQEKADVSAINERIRELEIKLRKKGHETDDFKIKYDSSQTLLKKKEQELRDLEEISTKMIGDITKGIGEKLAASKTREQELKSTLEKNESLEFDLEKLGKTFKQQNEDLIRIKVEEKKINEQLYLKSAELIETLKDRDEQISELKGENETLSLKNVEQTETVKEKNEEIERLKEQVNTLTKRFRLKVKEIQETLSNYNETLKSKNNEIVDKAQEIIELQEHNSTQGHLINKLKDTIGKHIQDIVQLKESEEVMKTNIIEQKAAFEEYKVQKKTYDDGKTKLKFRKRKLTSDKADQVNLKRFKSEELKVMKSLTLKYDLQYPFPGHFLPIFDSPISIQFPSPLLCIEYNWPVVSYRPDNLLMNLQFRLQNCSSKLFQTDEDPLEEQQVEDVENVGSKRKKSEVVSSSKRFRISPSNRPVSCQNHST